MAGLVPAIHVLLLALQKDVDARHKAGHDDGETAINPKSYALLANAPSIMSTVFCSP